MWRMIICAILLLTRVTYGLNYMDSRYVTTTTNQLGQTTNLQTTLDGLATNVARIPDIESELSNAVMDTTTLSNWVVQSVGAQAAVLASATNYVLGYSTAQWSDATNRVALLSVGLDAASNALLALTTGDVAALNTSFSAISNDFVSVSNTLFNGTNGIVPLVTTNQSITAKNFMLVNTNYVIFSNAIYKVASNLYASINPGGAYSATNVAIPYVLMETNYNTNYPSGMSITFPSLAPVITGVALSVVGQQLPTIVSTTIQQIVVQPVSVSPWSYYSMGTSVTGNPGVAWFTSVPASNTPWDIGFECEGVYITNLTTGLYMAQGHWGNMPTNIVSGHIMFGGYPPQISTYDNATRKYLYISAGSRINGEFSFMFTIDGTCSSVASYIAITNRAQSTIPPVFMQVMKVGVSQ